MPRTHTRPLRLLVALFSCSLSAGPHAVTQAYKTVGEQPAHFALAASQSQRKNIGWQQPCCCEESCRFNLARCRFAVTSPSTPRVNHRLTRLLKQFANGLSCQDA